MRSPLEPGCQAPAMTAIPVPAAYHARPLTAPFSRRPPVAKLMSLLQAHTAHSPSPSPSPLTAARGRLPRFWYLQPTGLLYRLVQVMLWFCEIFPCKVRVPESTAFGFFPAGPF